MYKLVTQKIKLGRFVALKFNLKFNLRATRDYILIRLSTAWFMVKLSYLHRNVNPPFKFWVTISPDMHLCPNVIAMESTQTTRNVTGKLDAFVLFHLHISSCCFFVFKSGTMTVTMTNAVRCNGCKSDSTFISTNPRDIYLLHCEVWATLKK